jgi:hypothetical protein
MHRFGFAAGALSVALMSGCATGTRFNGPGTYDDFVKARYPCLQKNTRPVSGVAATQGGLFGRSRNLPNCSALAACMGAKGYFRAKDGQFSNEGIGIECD